MKRNFFIVTTMVFVAIFILSAVPQNAFAQLSKKQEKTLQKEQEKAYKKKIAEYKKDRYASLASGNIKGRVMSMLRADANVPETEIDKFIAEYENSVKAEVSGVLTENYSLVKDNGDGTKSYQTIFILNEEKAGAARKLALERSLKDTKITNEEAGDISKFVDEGFSVE